MISLNMKRLNNLKTILILIMMALQLLHYFFIKIIIICIVVKEMVRYYNVNHVIILSKFSLLNYRNE